ncbi:MAG: T9SS type A sorting domain-containing protein [Limnohabitans sp.]|nr:T9SS type A sorting domain-containing protein [Limnohabitans sp.]
MRKTLLLVLLFQSFLISAQCWQTISAGGSHTIAIRNGGTLWTWGRNNFGQLGSSGVPSSQSNIPIQVGISSDWSKISAGSSHALAIKTNGTLWAWGRNNYGQLGNNSTVDSNIPIQIGVDTDWAYISAGDNYCLALKNNGTLWAWGDNANGQLGNGNSGSGNMVLVPTQIGSIVWQTISAGTDHSLGIQPDGSLWAWGRNNNGKLGNSSTVDSYTPTQIGTSTSWKEVAASQAHSVGKMTDDSVWTWGDNTSGQLGNGSSGTTAYKTTPQNISYASNSTKIAKGYQHTVVRKNNGKLYSWGGNVSGQLGDGSNTQKTTPVLVNNDSDWDYIDSKASHTVALKTDGSLFSWGNNLYGQLGIGSFSAQNTPQLVSCPTLASENFELASSIRLYPNPVNDFIKIESSNSIIINKIDVVDVSGKVLIEKTNAFEEIDMSQLSTGIYLIKINSREGAIIKKVIKD